MKIRTAIRALKTMEEELEYQRDCLEETKSYLKDYEEEADPEELEEDNIYHFHRAQKQHILNEIWELEEAIKDIEETEI